MSDGFAVPVPGTHYTVEGMDDGGVMVTFSPEIRVALSREDLADMGASLAFVVPRLKGSAVDGIAFSVGCASDNVMLAKQ